MTFPVPAATTILLRENNDRIEVLLQQRHPSMVFGGSWVFPGGTLCQNDMESEAPPIEERQAVYDYLESKPQGLITCALRELEEEAGIHSDQLLAIGHDASKLVYFNRWITPKGSPKRFDTRFYVVAIDVQTQTQDDPKEIAQSLWLPINEAFQRGESGDLPMIFPTIKNLQWLSQYTLLDDLVATLMKLPKDIKIEPIVQADNNRFLPAVGMEIEKYFT